MPYTAAEREETIQSGFRGYLLSLPEVQVLCGERVTTRQRNAGEPMPAITFFTLDEQGYDTFGDAASETLLTTLQVDIWTRTERDAQVLKWAIRGKPSQTRLHGYFGRWGTLDVQCATILAIRDMDEAPEGEGQEGVFRTSLDVSICWNEPS